MKKKYLSFILSNICSYISFENETFNIYDFYYKYPTFLV